MSVDFNMSETKTNLMRAFAGESPVSYTHLDALVYTCQSRILDQEYIDQLKYIIGQYRWELYKV